jgi:hypothetical protein
MMSYVDTPGFNSTKGPESEICDSYCNSRIFDIGIKMKILLVVDVDHIKKSGRGNAFVNSLNRIKNMFP